IDALLNGLNGRFISPGKGNDPIRTPDALPTGRNFYALDGSLLRPVWVLILVSNWLRRYWLAKKAILKVMKLAIAINKASFSGPLIR
ncbi:hypothetical protein E8Q33_15040, partial [Methylophaga sp. SB9B]